MDCGLPSGGPHTTSSEALIRDSPQVDRAPMSVITWLCTGRARLQAAQT